MITRVSELMKKLEDGPSIPSGASADSLGDKPNKPVAVVKVKTEVEENGMETGSGGDPKHTHVYKLDSEGDGVTSGELGHSHFIVSFECQSSLDHTHEVDRVNGEKFDLVSYSEFAKENPEIHESNLKRENDGLDI